METNDKPSFFDRPLAELLKPNWEKAIYLAIFLLAVVSRFWDLGARAMSHDESLHALYSYYLYNGSGYVHNPMMHGPFLFHANALIYFLFGDNDFTARIVPALFGVFMVMSPLLLRRWLGRLGAIVTSILLLISPSILYYSRYIRNDIYIAVWTMLLIAALFHFIRSRKPGWFYLGAAVLMLSLATKENAYIFGFIGLLFIIEVILWERFSRRESDLALRGRRGAEPGLAGWRPTCWDARRPKGQRPPKRLQAVAEARGRAGHGGGRHAAGGAAQRQPDPLPASPAAAASRRRSAPCPGSNWLIAIVVMFLIYALLFTTFFTNPGGPGHRHLWLDQLLAGPAGGPARRPAVVLLSPAAAHVRVCALLFSLIATVYYLVRGSPRLARSRPPEEDAEAQASEAARADAVGQADRPGLGSDAALSPFLIFWTITTLFIYSWAGEKMPWLVVHPVLPMIILTGKFAGDLFERVDWRAVWQRGGALLALLLPITLFGLYTLDQAAALPGALGL